MKVGEKLHCLILFAILPLAQCAAFCFGQLLRCADAQLKLIQHYIYIYMCFHF